MMPFVLQLELRQALNSISTLENIWQTGCSELGLHLVTTLIIMNNEDNKKIY